MIQRYAKGAVASVLVFGLYGVTPAANPLPPESRVVAAAGAPAPTQLAFTIASAEDLQVTLKDLQIPAPLSSAGIALTQGDAIVGSASLAAPATSATFSVAGATGNYTLYVFGLPGASDSVGTFTACVAPKANPSACIANASLAGNITAAGSAKNPTVSTLSTNLIVTTGGPYVFNFADLQFPTALASAPNLLLSQGSTVIQAPIPSGTSINLSPGTYTLLAIAEADPTVQSGLYGITISGPSGLTPLLDRAIPVGLTAPSTALSNPSAQQVTLKVTDFGFPGPLASASAMLTSGGASLSEASAGGGAMTVAAPEGALNVWTYASPGATPGTYEVDVLAGTAHLFTFAQGANPAGSANAYGFVTPPVVAGTYQATAADLQFPSQLGPLSFAVAQNGVILAQSASAATLNVTAAAAPLLLLASAQAPAAGAMSGNGVFDVNLQTGGTSPQLVYDKTQSVSSTPSLFDSQTITLGNDANFTATLADLKFPAAFDSLALVISRGTAILGKIYGGGAFNFAGSVGSYQLTFVAGPAAQQDFGLYGVSLVFAAPSITAFTSSATSAATGAPITLTWNSTSATTCTGSGGSFNTNGATSGTQSVVLSATTTYALTCTGAGGNASQSVKVEATAAASSGGSGSWDLGSLGAIGLAWAVSLTFRRLRSVPG